MRETDRGIERDSFGHKRRNIIFIIILFFKTAHSIGRSERVIVRVSRAMCA